MLKAVAYCRYSSDNQREESIQAQYRAIKEYCDNNDILIIKTYVDEAFSARTDDRPAFLEMIKESKSGVFNLVIVHKLDRFSRSRYDSAFYKKQLKENGVKLISITENLDDSPESIILESLLEGMSEYYSANLSREVIKGMKENAFQCKFNGGAIPLGYDIVNQKYVINEEEAKIVNLAFSLYTKGISCAEIANILNEKGYRNKKGKEFKSHSFYNLLKNKLYIGTYEVKFKKEKIEIENGVPAIVSNELFYKAQLSAKNRGFQVKKDNYNYFLTDLVYYNNKKMTGKGGTSHTGKLYHYYAAPNEKYVNAELLEEAVKEVLTKVILHEDNIEKLVDISYKKFNKANPEERSSIERKLKNLDTKIDNIITAIMDGIKSDRLKSELETLENQKSLLTEELDRLNLTKNYSREEIKEGLLHLINNIDEINTLKQILRLVVERINVTENGAIQVKMRNYDSSHKIFMVGRKLNVTNLFTFTYKYIQYDYKSI